MLDSLLDKIEGMTSFKDYKLRLKFATDEELSVGTRHFFNNAMKHVIGAVDAELTSVLGSYWVNMKAQSNLLVAVHSILVLWKVH